MNTKSTLRLLSLIAALALTVSVFGTASVSADSGSASYTYLIGVAGPIGPDVAMADNGDTVAVVGRGTLSIHPDSVSGGGTFTHKNSGGGVLAAGTWTATQLQSFVDYGTSPLFPPTLHAGEALIRVHLVVTSGPSTGAQADAVLTVNCALTGAKVPDGHDEGIRLAVQNLINFNKHVSGQTVFIK